MELEFKDPHGDDDVYSCAYEWHNTCGLCRFGFSQGDVIMSGTLCKDSLGFSCPS